MSRFDEREIESVTDVIKSGKLSPFFKNFDGGPNVQAFEKEFAEYVGAEFGIAVSNGTTALEIALRACKVGPGDEVITTPLSFVATASAILAVGATPIFADINGSLNLDFNSAEKAITKKTKAIIPVSLCGHPVDSRFFSGFLQNPKTKRKIWVIEDCAQGLGSRDSNGKMLGSRADLSTFSFQETKQITTLGEGGMITTNHYGLSEFVKHIRNHGNSYARSFPLTDIVSTNSRMTEAQAAFGRVQLKKLDEINSHSMGLAQLFYGLINEKRINICPAINPLGDNQVLSLLPFWVPRDFDDSSLLVNWLKYRGDSKTIPGQNVGKYSKLLYDLPIFAKYAPRKGLLKQSFGDLEFARDAVNRIILFDIHRWKTNYDSIHHCVNSLVEFFKIGKGD